MTMDITSRQNAMLIYAQRVLETVKTLASCQPRSAQDIRDAAHAVRVGADALDGIAAHWDADTDGGDYARNVLEEVDGAH
jgi:hypothetical protein